MRRRRRRSASGGVGASQGGAARLSAPAWPRRGIEVLSPGPQTTRKLGLDLAALTVPGDLVLLDGALGSGKTELVRGLAQGLGADPDEVASPTFALVHEYGPAGRPPLLAHADLYRLGDEASRRTLPELGIEELRRAGAVVAIEWPLPPFTGLPAWRVTLTDLGSDRRSVRLRFA
ncbi:MAG: tRNA (adenosine(37)-N6)-threonylcarbamoyltransferase complex ATPase subunit type 1 TsaE [Acidobacteria bacterium ACB2]|nr:tRNA (adenosine(37)-N6)-threonylcarbamoyltransferase complex ATPase subunit type 1 TsaE [Acidobacteria bacterium ACB2]